MKSYWLVTIVAMNVPDGILKEGFCLGHNLIIGIKPCDRKVAMKHIHEKLNTEGVLSGKYDHRIVKILELESYRVIE